jgi:hypothetical protein
VSASDAATAYREPLLRLVARILAVLAAVVAYVVVFQLALLVAVVFIAENGGEGDGFVLEVVALPGWVGVLWWVGLVAVVWFVGFRLSWWRRAGSSQAN